MIVSELIDCLRMCQDNAEVYVASPNRRKDYFLDGVRVESDKRDKGTVIFLDTSQ